MSRNLRLFLDGGRSDRMMHFAKALIVLGVFFFVGGIGLLILSQITWRVCSEKRIIVVLSFG